MPITTHKEAIVLFGEDYEKHLSGNEMRAIAHNDFDCRVDDPDDCVLPEDNFTKD